MVIYWIMFVYTITVSFFIEFLNKNRGPELICQDENTAIRTVGIFGAVIAFSLIIIFPGIRGYVADTTAYIAAFQNETRTIFDIPSLFVDLANAKGPLWVAFQIIVKNYICDDVTVFFIIVAVFQGFAVAKTFSIYSEHFTFSSYLFITSYTFFWMLNGTRQFTAVCILLLASKYLFNKQFGWYLLWILVAFCIHSTAILFVIVYFIVQGEPFNKKVVWTIILVLLCIFFVDIFMGVLDSTFNDTQYSFSKQDYNIERGMSLFVTLMNAVPVVLVWWNRNTFFAQERPKYIDVMVNLSCINVGICAIANFTSGITFGRLPVYFNVYNYILIPWIVEKTFSRTDRVIMRVLCVIFYMCYFVYQGYFSGNGGGGYHTFFMDFFYENFSLKLF